MKRRGHTATPVILMSAEEFFTLNVESAEYFATADPDALLDLPRALPEPWQTALDSLRPAKKHSPPMSSLPYDHTTGLTLSAWHDGSQYQIIAAGRPEAILDHAELTSNERETLQLEINKRSGEGKELLGIMSASSRSVPRLDASFWRNIQFTLAGFIAFRRRVHAATLRQAKQARSGGATLQFVSEYAPDFIAALTAQHGLVSRDACFIDASLLPLPLPDDRTKKLEYATGIGRITPETAQVIKPLLISHTTHVSSSARQLLS